MARATLGYLALTSGMAGGVVGLPLAGTVMFLKDLFGDDDDEEGDAKTRLRNTLYDLTGDKTLADVLAKGVPTLFGMDIAERAGMGTGGTDVPAPGPCRAARPPRISWARRWWRWPDRRAGWRFRDGRGVVLRRRRLGARHRTAVAQDDGRPCAPHVSATGQEDRKGEQLMSSEELNYWDTIRRVAACRRCASPIGSRQTARSRASSRA